MTAKPVAKSLHTVSVLVNVAKHFMELDHQCSGSAMERTMHCLGLADRDDPYGLEAQALKQLEALNVQPITD